MRNHSISPYALTLAALTGSVVSAHAADPAALSPTAANIKHEAHIYFNVATGEKIITKIGPGDVARPVDGSESDEIWVMEGTGCEDQGISSSFFFGIDDPDGTTPLALGATLADWGDIPNDTVVDCVQIHWITNHADTDTDGDSFADGIEGFAGNWSYWEAFNGRSPQVDSIAVPIIGFGLFSLPGELSDPGDSLVAFYTADIDLAASFSSSLTFEIGDTDSDAQGAAVTGDAFFSDRDFDSVPDNDPDQDGLTDWAWSLGFNQPGTVDVDNADGDSDTQTGIDGDIADLATAGVVFGVPQPGQAEFDTVSGEWSYVPDAEFGLGGSSEDLFTLIDSSGTNQGPFFFGGFSCDIDPETGSYTPYSGFQVVLYGPGGGLNNDCGDLDGNGVLDFFDLSIFLQNTIDWDGNTTFDFFDLSAYLQQFSIGCP